MSRDRNNDGIAVRLSCLAALGALFIACGDDLNLGRDALTGQWPGAGASGNSDSGAAGAAQSPQGDAASSPGAEAAAAGAQSDAGEGIVAPEGDEPPSDGADGATGGTEPPSDGADGATGGAEPPSDGADGATGGTEPPSDGADGATGGTEPPADGATGGTEPPTDGDGVVTLRAFLEDSNLQVEWHNGTRVPIFVEGCSSVRMWGLSGAEWTDRGALVFCFDAVPAVEIPPQSTYRDPAAEGLPATGTYRFVGSYGTECAANMTLAEASCAGLLEATSNQVDVVR